MSYDYLWQYDLLMLLLLIGLLRLLRERERERERERRVDLGYTMIKILQPTVPTCMYSSKVYLYGTLAYKFHRLGARG